MVLTSMTGYAFLKKSINKKVSVAVEIKSLNGKYLDLQIKIPKVFNEKEVDLRRSLLKRLTRGKVALSLEIIKIQTPQKKIIDTQKFNEIFKHLEDLKQKFSSSSDTFNQVLAFKEIYHLEEKMGWPSWNEVLPTINQALNKFEFSRIKEGRYLKKDIETKIKKVKKEVGGVKKLILKAALKNKSKTKNILSKNIEEDKNIQDKINQALLVFLEKHDVSEEITRIDYHLKNFIDTLQEKESGKKLIFISQELIREANTIASKTNTAVCQNHVVVIKSEIEKIKEQLYNVL